MLFVIVDAEEALFEFCLLTSMLNAFLETITISIKKNKKLILSQKTQFLPKNRLPRNLKGPPKNFHFENSFPARPGTKLFTRNSFENSFQRLASSSNVLVKKLTNNPVREQGCRVAAGLPGRRGVERKISKNKNFLGGPFERKYCTIVLPKGPQKNCVFWTENFLEDLFQKAGIR